MRTFLLALLIAAFAAPALVTTETVTVPQWRIRFLDLKGEPLRGLALEQSWRNYSVESAENAAGNLASGVTDGDGYATLPERRLRASLLARVIGPVRSVLRGGLHAPFGGQSSIYAGCGLLPGGWAQPVYAGSQLPDTVTLRYAGLRDAPAGFAPGDPCESLIRQTVGAEPGPKERIR